MARQKRGEFLFGNKKAQTDSGYGDLIFIVLNLAFFSILFLWVWSSSNAAFVYEEAYAKEIALIIDKAEPGMHFEIDFSKGMEKAEENEIDKKNIILINEAENRVRVKLSERGFSFRYFTDYNVSSYIGTENKLVIIINEKS